MYIEEFTIHNYRIEYDNWESQSDEERGEEPEKPLVLRRREEEEWVNPPMAPDIMELMGGW